MLRVVSFSITLLVGAAAGAAEPVHFESWSPALFARARAEHRYVLLDLGAVWCHWCHVMEETTYRDPSVARLLGDRFIAVRADQDADPDLSRRYEEYGWPATIVFAPDGSEIVKRRGYITPPAMTSLLQAIVDDPSPGPSVRPELPWAPSTRTRLAAAARRRLEDTFVRAFDRQNAGWGTIHKFVDAEPIELALADERWAPMARRTLDAGLALIDPVWGGMYQYSDAVDWRSPHYEKIMALQAQSIEVYVRGYQKWHDARYLAAARAIARYLTTQLASPDGTFYTSQDADLDEHTPGKKYYALDDAGRRALGMPRIDRHVYPRENGWAIRALCILSVVTDDAGEREALVERARRAADWIYRHRRLPDGTYAHGERDPAGPYLGDTLAMAEAYFTLGAADGNRSTDRIPWAERALEAMRALVKQFRHPQSGFVTAPVAADAVGVFREAARLVDENIAVARLAHMLQVSDPTLGDAVAHAMRYLSSPTLLQARPFSPGLVLLDRELGRATVSVR